MPFTPFSPAAVAVKQADIGAAGTALVNGTPTFLTWTAPNDGNMHQFTVSSFLSVASLETGGAVLCNYTGPGNNATNFNVQPGAQAAGINATSNTRLCQPGSTVSVAQNVALTAGAATLWAQIWGV